MFIDIHIHTFVCAYTTLYTYIDTCVFVHTYMYTLRCKNIVYIATFNVRVLNRLGKLLELTASAAEHNE